MTYAELADLLDTTDTVAIVTRRASGEPTATPIWSVAVDGVPYVRSYLGDGAYWYRHALAGRPVAFVLGDGKVAEQSKAAALALPSQHVLVEHVPADDAIQTAIDEAFSEKYDRFADSRDAILTPQARGCTLRILAD